MSVVFDHDHGAQPRRARVLAVSRLRGNLERLSTAGQARRSSSMAVSRHDLMRELDELIAALDRRVPRVEQAGETAIARDAAALRAKAVERLAELAIDPAVEPEPGSGDPAEEP
jgi:hypothetical protein